jgi:hypothetical protein
MKPKIHLTVGIIATWIIAIFLTSTLLVELIGSRVAIATLKSLIVMPGLFILIPTIAMTGVTGFLLSKSRKGSLVEKKKKRMPLIALNGIFILVPAALLLNTWASKGSFGKGFYFVQVIEIIAGAANLVMMGLSIRDGLRLGGRLRPHTEAELR